MAWEVLMPTTLAAPGRLRIRDKYGRTHATAADVVPPVWMETEVVPPPRRLDMATATKKAPIKKAPIKKAPIKKAPARKAEKGTLDYLDLALENLKKAREHAQKDARAQIDSAIERIVETVKDVTAEIRRHAHTGG
jgi:uncharacterized FlaG/YvyC family protein